MGIIAAAVRELIVAGLTGDALISAIERIEDQHPRSAAALRQARYRERKASRVTSQTSRDVTSPSHSPKKDSSSLSSLRSESSEALFSPSDLERELFRRGKQVLGKEAGGMIKRLLEAKKYDVALARSVIETASTKQDPREYVGAIIRNANGGVVWRSGIEGVL